MPSEAHHATNNQWVWLGYGALATGAAIILAPHVLPELGIGKEAADVSNYVLHAGLASNGTPLADAGSGLAAIVNQQLYQVPWVGKALAEGGVFNALMASVIGLGGAVLGAHLEKYNTNPSAVKWGGILKITSMATSALIALPTLISGLTMGLSFMAYMMLDGQNANALTALTDSVLGQAGSDPQNHVLGFSGIAAVIPHALTCGVALVPAITGLVLSADRQKTSQGGDDQITITTRTSTPTQAGKQCEITLHLTHTNTGKPYTLNELETVHTEKIHLFVVDQSLRDYHHIHPVPTGNPGVFKVTFTPNSSNSYQVWADVTDTKTQTNHRIVNTLAAKERRNIPPQIAISHLHQKDGVSFGWKADGPLMQGTPTMVEITTMDTLGKPLHDLEDVMGEKAHLVGFGADGTSIVHTHPVGSAMGTPDKLIFHIEAEHAGPTQFYLQIRRHGKDEFIPFGQVVLGKAVAPEKSATCHAASAATAGRTAGVTL